MTSNTQKANPTGTGVLSCSVPANTVTSGDGARPRAFLADCVHRTDADLTTRHSDEPAHTIKGSDFRRPCNEPKAFLLHGTSTLALRDEEESSAAVMATVHAKAAMPRAFLCHGSDMRSMPVVSAEDPAFTLMANSNGNGNTARAFLMPLQGENAEARGQAQPALTVTANHAAEKCRAFLVDGKPANYDGDTLQIKEGASPTPPVTATQTQHPFRAWLSQGRVVSMTPRALARFQSVPDWYALPANKKLACVVLGNGVPPLMMQRIAESLTP